MGGAGTFTTILDALEIRIRLGIHPDEVAAPQRVRVSVWMEVDYGGAAPADRIEEAVDYDFVRIGIHNLAKSRHFALQETLCEAVAQLCFAADPRVRQVRVRTMKPDIYPDAAIGCEIVRGRKPI